MNTVEIRDHDTEEEAARAFDRAAINKAGSSAATNYPIEDYHHEIDALQQVSVIELVASLRAKARRHGAQTSQYRGVSLLKQTGKWHGQINVGGKQLHLGFFSTEELAARAYDMAAIHKASVEGGVVVTNLDMSEYRGEIEKLQSMTQKELLSMIADEKKSAAGVKRAHHLSAEKEEKYPVASSRDLQRAAEVEVKGERREASPSGSSEDTDTDGGGARGGEGGNGTSGRRSKSSSSSQLTRHDRQDVAEEVEKEENEEEEEGEDGARVSLFACAFVNFGQQSGYSRTPAPCEREGDCESPVTSLRETEGLRPTTVTITHRIHQIAQRQARRGRGVSTGAHEVSCRPMATGTRAGAGSDMSRRRQGGTKRTAAEVILSTSPRAAGKHRRTKQAPRQAPVAA